MQPLNCFVCLKIFLIKCLEEKEKPWLHSFLPRPIKSEALQVRLRQLYFLKATQVIGSGPSLPSVSQHLLQGKGVWSAG